MEAAKERVPRQCFRPRAPPPLQVVLLLPFSFLGADAVCVRPSARWVT